MGAMPPVPNRPPRLRGKIFRGAAAVAAGLLTPTQLRSRAWRRLLRGIYADADLPVTHELRCRAVAGFVLLKGGAIAGRSAAVLLGPGLAGALDPIDVLVPTSTRPRTSEVVAHIGPLPAAELVRVRGIPVTTPVRTCWDLVQWLPTVEAIVLLDRFVRAGLVTLAALSAHAVARKGTFGAARFTSALALVDGRSESPQESRLRVLMVLAGLPKPRTQFEIYDDEGFIARVDLAYPESRVAVEYDGVWHASSEQLHRDRRRLNRLQAAGWLVIHVTAARLREDPDAVVREITGAIAGRRRRSAR
jgi:very-short-patch-repair endonuclease